MFHSSTGARETFFLSVFCARRKRPLARVLTGRNFQGVCGCEHSPHSRLDFPSEFAQASDYKRPYRT